MDPEEVLHKVSQLEDETRRLQRSLEELSILNEIASAISSTTTLNRIVELIVQKCVKHLKVEQGAVMLFQEGEPGSPFRTIFREVNSQLDTIPYRLGEQALGWILKNQSPLLINDLQRDSRFESMMGEELPIRSILSVPLRLQGRLIGLLNVFNKRAPEGFTPEDQRLLSIIATQSAQVIENARLCEEEKALFRMREELRLAYEIQTNLLPKGPPDIPGYDIAGRSLPAQNVGGDYFDFIPIHPDQLAICVGDVSGKGMPAALLMANLQATIRAQTLLKVSAGNCLQQANPLLFRSTDLHRFVTLFYGILNTRKHLLCYSNAGHSPPFLFSEAKDPMRLETGGLILGITEDSLFEEALVSFTPGELLLLYSDGVIEATDSHEEEFGEKRLQGVVMENWGDASSVLIDKILKAVQSHTEDSPQTDDITLVVVQRKTG